MESLTRINEKIMASQDAVNGLKVTEINTGTLEVNTSELSLFNHSLKVAKLYGDANNYLTSKEGKNELFKLGIDATKYEILKAMFGKSDTQIKLYINVSKIPSEIVEEFKAQTIINRTLENLKKYAKNEGEGEGEGEGAKVEKAQNFSITYNKKLSKWTIKGANVLTKSEYTLLLEEVKKLEPQA